MCSSADSSPPESRSIRLMVAKQTVTEAGPPHNQFWKLTSNPNFPRKIHWQDRCTDVGWHGSAPLNLSQPLHQIGIWPRTTHTHGEESDQNDNQRTRERERDGIATANNKDERKVLILSLLLHSHTHSVFPCLSDSLTHIFGPVV